MTVGPARRRDAGRRSRAAATALAFTATAFGALAGCYHRATPPLLGETVRVRVVIDDARLVRAQAYLQAEVARALQDRLGWKVAADGTARLDLTMREETIASVGTDARDIPVRWSITLHGHALLASRQGNDLGDYIGTGYASSLADEPDALQAAAQQSASAIATWLETAGRRWDPRPFEPGSRAATATAGSMPTPTAPTPAPLPTRSATDSPAADAVAPTTPVAPADERRVEPAPRRPAPAAPAAQPEPSGPAAPTSSTTATPGAEPTSAEPATTTPEPKPAAAEPAEPGADRAPEPAAPIHTRP